MQQPLISIGMSVFNGEKTLLPTIRSLQNQTHEHWELILMDDGSTDQTVRLARDIDDSRIRVYSDGRNRKLPTRLNQCVALSRGGYFARMDCGDLAYPERLAKQAAYLETHPGIDLLASRIIIFAEGGRVIGTYTFKQTHREISSRPTSGFYFAHPTWMGRTEWFRQHPYRVDMNKSQDQELLLRTYRSSCFACLPHILLGYQKNSLSLVNILKSRYYSSRALLIRSVLDKNYVLAAGVLNNIIKALVETFAIAAGLDYRILRHRSIPVDPLEIPRWRQVWNSCQKVYGENKA
ncbi:MAG TPA: glycosyltransferase family 2 protein [Deltaproteobacteria bacterium]|nr:glycosyltransferase family 2 protein [Deltaproteobacteria bacterium]